MKNALQKLKNSIKANKLTKLKASGGFSLIELMVAVGVFAVVVTITSGTFVISLRGQGKSATAQNVADNTRYAMEVIAKEIRMGRIKATEGFVLNSPSDIQFKSNMPNRNGSIVRFYLDATTHQIMFDDDINDGSGPGKDPESITAANVTVNALTFDVSGVSSEMQPRITIVMRVASAGTAADIATSMDLQTTISPRSL